MICWSPRRTASTPATLEFNSGYRNLVRVTGYPADEEEPVTCQNWTKEQSASQLRFDCNGFTGGTSGSPWVTRFDPTTSTGRIVGVLGGYQEGGSTPDISYSSYLGDAIRQLYEQAIKLTRVPAPALARTTVRARPTGISSTIMPPSTSQRSWVKRPQNHDHGSKGAEN
jgi:hypothetical protein